MTTMVDRPEPAVDSSRITVDRGFGRLRAATWILGFLVVAMGAWIIYDYFQDTALAPGSEIAQLIDDYQAAWNNYDGEAFLATTRAGYTFTDNTGGTFDRDDQLAVIENTLPRWSWQVEQLAEPMIVGDGPWWFVTIPKRVSGTLFDSTEGISVLTVVNHDGEYLIANHAFTGR